MQSIQLDKLPDFAQRELLDFYHFLLQKYRQHPLAKREIARPLAPRLVKPFEPLSREQLYER